MRTMAGVVALALVACGDHGRSAPAATAVDTPAIATDAGVDGLTDDQRNAIALEAFMAADRLATDTRRILLDSQAHQTDEVRVVMEWLHAVRDGGDYEEEFLDAEELQLIYGFVSMNPQFDVQLVPGGIRVSTKDDLDDAELKDVALTFTVGRDSDGELVVTHIDVRAPHADLNCSTED